MAGHSKWAQIKRKKGAKDKERGAQFSKLSRAITIAVSEGGGVPDPERNLKLRLAIEKAKHANMPKDTITRAIEKGTGPDKDTMREIVYEGFGPGGVALLISCATDNPNRILHELRNMLEGSGGKLGTQGSVAYLFKKCAVVTLDKDKNPEDAVYTFAEQLEAFDLDDDEIGWTVYFPFDHVGLAKQHQGTLVMSPVEIDFKPQTTIPVRTKEGARRLLNLVERVEALEDVQKVFANFDIPIGLMEEV